MKFIITDICIRCGACATDCPVKAIDYKHGKFIINDQCIGCGDCYTICPVGAVTPAEKIKHSP